MRTFEEVFADWWSLLCDRFGVEKPARVAAFYCRTLKPRLSAEQLDEAMERVAYANTYFPSPQEIAEAVSGNVEQEAVREWELCERVMRGERHVLERMSSVGRRTVGLMGGADRLGQTLEDELHFRRKEFLKLYPDAHEIHQRERRVLPPWTEEGRRALRQVLDGEVGDADDDESPRAPALAAGTPEDDS